MQNKKKLLQSINSIVFIQAWVFSEPDDSKDKYRGADLGLWNNTRTTK